MKNVFKTMAFTLLGLVLSVNLMADVAPVNTVLWSETWTGASTGTSGNDNYTPSANYGKGTTVYNGGSVSYAQSANTVYVRNEELAQGAKPELMLTKSKTWTISNISTCGAIELSLTYKSNNTKSSVTCSTSGVEITGSSKSYTIKSTTDGGALPEKITIVFGCSDNTRIDNVELKVTTAGVSKTPLTTPTGLTVGTKTSTTAEVSWNSVTDAGSYKVEYKTSSASNWTAVSPNPTTTSCTITGLTPSTTYNWRVTAIPSATATTKDNSSAANGDNFTTAAPAKHKVYFSANGTIINTGGTEVTEGNAINFPATATGCEGKTFMGWYDKDYSDPTDAPTYVTSAIMGGSDVTYYAVFADVEGMMCYKKVTAPTIGKTYIFVSSATAGNAFALDAKQMATSASSSSPAKGVTITSSGSDIIVSTINTDLEFKYVEESSKKNFDIVCSTTGEKLVINGSGIGKVISSYKSFWDDNKGLYGTNSKGTTSYYVWYNSASGTAAFQATSGASARVYAYEKQEATYSNYTTTCAAVYEATVATGITNGSVLISKTDDAMAGAASLTGLHEGDKVYIFPTANTGYKLDAVTVNGTPITDTEGKYIYTIAEEGITVSATFAPATYNITYNLDGGEWNGEAGVATYTYGTGVPTLPTNVEKANNTFLGWYVSNPAEIVTSIGTTETGDKSFIASWLPSGARDVTYSGDEQLNYISNPQIVDKEDPSLTVTYSVNKGYTISAVAVTVNDAALTESEVVFDDEQLTITPTAGFTGNVSITFTVVEKNFTVTWMANKAKFKEEQIKEGSKVTLPAGTPEDVISGEDTYKFQGWFTEEQYSNETTAPAYITNNTIEPEGDVTYYAVYAIEEKTPSTTTYTRVTEESQLQTASSLVIVNNSASKLFTNALGTATAPTESNGEITVNNTDMWSLSYANSKYTISNASGTLGAATMPAKSSGNYNKPMSITTSNNSWTIAESGTDLFVLKNANNVGIEYYSSNWVVYINDNIAGVEACAHKLYIPKMINTTKNYRTRVAIIDHIAVHGTPVTTNFVAGETFDATGLTIDVYYQGEDNPTNVTEGFTYDPTGALKTTDENITFTYQGKTADVAISVSNTVSKIEVTTDPSKMEYTEGEQFNPTGMVVTATYGNGAERDVTGYDYEPKGDLALGNKITISFGGQTTDLGITINEATKTTVNWFVEGVKLTEGEQSTAVIPGKKITALPTEPTACTGNQFVGWTAVDANYYNATTAPTDLFKTLADAPTIGETETNFYAVFASEAVGTYDEKVTLTALDAPTADKFTYAFAKNSGTQPSWVESASEARAYVNNTLTITSKNNRIITKIEYTYNINKNKSDIAPTGATVIGNNSDNGSWDATNKTWTSSTNAATTVTLTVNGSAGNYGFTAIKVYLTGGTVLSDYSTTCLAALANPTITTAEGEYCGSVDVEITQPAGNPDGAKIMYSTDNETWNEYTAAVNITTSGTVYAKVVKDPKETEVVSATYTVYPRYTLAQAATAAASATDPIIGCVSFTDLLVNGKSSNMLFTEDADGNVYTFSYKGACDIARGDKIEATDAHLTFSKVNGVLNFASVDDVTTMSQNNPTKPSEATAITAIKAGGYYAHVVKLANVTMHVVDATAKSYTLIDEETNEIAIANTFIPTLPTWLEGAKYDVYGIIVLDGEGNPMIAPRNSKGANEDGDMISLAEKLDAPEDLVVSNITSCGASFAWGEVTNASKYSVYIYDKDEKEVAKSENRTICTYAPTTKFEANSTYTWKVKAIGDNISYTESDYAQGTFTTNPNAKLNWYVGGSFYQSTDASQEKVVTPDDPTSPCPTNYENFVTWYTEEIVSETGQLTALDAAKKVKAGDAAASQAGSAKEYNFYAVFGKVNTPGTDKYVAVTSEPTKWEGEYLIVHNDSVFNGSQTTLDAEKNGVVLTKEEDGSYLASNANNYRFVIAKSTTKDEDDETAVYYTIQSASEYYIGGKDGSNGMNSNQKFATQTYDNILSWSEDKVEISSYYGNTYLTFNTASNQLRFRYMKSTSYNKNIVLYKREKTNPQYSGYITTCPQTYTITIANNTKGLVEAATTTEILKGAKVLLTATANAGYTKTGGAWVVKKTATSEVVEGLVGNTNYLTMPDYDVTVDYNFIAKTDNFVDNLHNNETKTAQGGGTEYVIPELEDKTEGTACDAYYIFDGWVTEQIFSDAPAQNDDMKVNPTYAEGNTYYALWMGDNGYITDCCNTSIPENLKALSTYLKATSAKLDWDNVTDATKYHIIVKQGETTLYDTDVEKSEFEITSGLTKETTYDVYVKAYAGCWSENAHIQFTTAAEIKSYSVTINAEGGTYSITPELVSGKIQEGEIVVVSDITVTDPEHYFFKELTIEPEVTDLTEDEGEYMFTMPSKAITINIVFAEYPTVTWKMEGAADVVTTAVLNEDKFEVGTVKEAPADWKYKTYFPEFAGWVTADKCDAEGNVTTAEFITATTEVPTDGLTVYGAVAKSSAPDCSTATKITSNENLDMSALYVIGAEYSEKTLFYNSIDGTWGKTTQEVSGKTPIIFTISGTKDAIALLGSDGNYIKGCTTKSFAISTDKQEVMIAEGGNIIFGTTTWYLQYNYNSGAGGLRWYSSTSYPFAYLYKVALAYEKLTINPQPDYGRTDLVVGNYGTVCVPYTVTVADRSGATFWNIETSNTPGYTNPTSVTIVEETEDLVAGKPYIFCATDTKMALFFSGNIYDGVAYGTDYPHYNGLYGNLTDDDYIINKTESEYQSGIFFVLQQKLYECGWNCTVAPNRGWVQAAEIVDKSNETPIGAPRRVIGNPNGTPTGINNLNADGLMNIQGARKYFHNNNIVIVNEGRIYNAQGILIQ